MPICRSCWSRRSEPVPPASPMIFRDPRSAVPAAGSVVPRRLFRAFASGPVLWLLLALLIVSMWGNARLNARVEGLCAAAGILEEEGAVAWEALAELAPGNIERDERRWRWALARRVEDCAGVPILAAGGAGGQAVDLR